MASSKVQSGLLGLCRLVTASLPGSRPLEASYWCEAQHMVQAAVMWVAATHSNVYLRKHNKYGLNMHSSYGHIPVYMIISVF